MWLREVLSSCAHENTEISNSLGCKDTEHLGDTEERKKKIQERDELKKAVKNGKRSVKKQKKEITKMAEASMGNDWTKKVLDQSMFDAEDTGGIDDQLAAVTHGLVTGDEFKRRKAALEDAEIEQAAEAEKAEKEAEEDRARTQREEILRRQKEKEQDKKDKKRKRKEQASKLSFNDDDEFT